ncbi:hypothetical protein [Spongorhabdus nitratireducens]
MKKATIFKILYICYFLMLAAEVYGHNYPEKLAVPMVSIPNELMTLYCPSYFSGSGPSERTYPGWYGGYINENGTPSFYAVYSGEPPRSRFTLLLPLVSKCIWNRDQTPANKQHVHFHQGSKIIPVYWPKQQYQLSVYVKRHGSMRATIGQILLGVRTKPYIENYPCSQLCLHYLENEQEHKLEEIYPERRKLDFSPVFYILLQADGSVTVENSLSLEDKHRCIARIESNPSAPFNFVLETSCILRALGELCDIWLQLYGALTATAGGSYDCIEAVRHQRALIALRRLITEASPDMKIFATWAQVELHIYQLLEQLKIEASLSPELISSITPYTQACHTINYQVDVQKLTADILQAQKEVVPVCAPSPKPAAHQGYVAFISPTHQSKPTKEKAISEEPSTVPFLTLMNTLHEAWAIMLSYVLQPQLDDSDANEHLTELKPYVERGANSGFQGLPVATGCSRVHLMMVLQTYNNISEKWHCPGHRPPLPGYCSKSDTSLNSMSRREMSPPVAVPSAKSTLHCADSGIGKSYSSTSSVDIPARLKQSPSSTHSVSSSPLSVALQQSSSGPRQILNIDGSSSPVIGFTSPTSMLPSHHTVGPHPVFEDAPPLDISRLQGSCIVLLFSCRDHAKNAKKHQKEKQILLDELELICKEVEKINCHDSWDPEKSSQIEQSASGYLKQLSEWLKRWNGGTAKKDRQLEFDFQGRY